MPSKVTLGHVVSTPTALERVPAPEVLHALARHESGDWGDVCKPDRKANELALSQGSRLLSSYKSEDGTKFWIITEADRSSTTVLLPEDY